MKGLELAKGFYLDYGKETIEKEFPEISDRIAAGLAGQGSECFGFDDEISADHDFEPGFCLWLTDEDYKEYGFKLERMYSKLPQEYKGYKRLKISPVGGNRHGVKKISDFYKGFIGSAGEPQSLEHWLYIPSEMLATACNGQVFCDNLGEFTKIRNKLLCGYPKDVKLKKMAAHLIMMSQSGLYNYPRCIERGENGAAQLCIFEFVKHTISIIFLLNNRFQPFYKWVYKSLRQLDVLSNLEGSLTALTELGNSDTEARAKRESMEQICFEILKQLYAQNYIDTMYNQVEKTAFILQNNIQDSCLRNMHIMDGV